MSDNPSLPEHARLHYLFRRLEALDDEMFYVDIHRTFRGGEKNGRNWLSEPSDEYANWSVEIVRVPYPENDEGWDDPIRIWFVGSGNSNLLETAIESALAGYDRHMAAIDAAADADTVEDSIIAYSALQPPIPRFEPGVADRDKIITMLDKMDDLEIWRAMQCVADILNARRPDTKVARNE